MTRHQHYIWQGAPQPVTPADTQFMKNLLAGVRRIREQATNRLAAPSTPQREQKENYQHGN